MNTMRRKDRQMDESFALEVIDNSEYGVLGLGNEEPYTIPLSIVREGKTLYFHSAPEGKKTELIKDGDSVSVSFVSRAKVPRIFTKDQVEEIIKEKSFGKVGSKVFTTEFSSTHIMGKIYEVKDEEEIIFGLMLIAKKYTPEMADLAIDFIKNSLHRTRLYKIEIIEIQGKRKQFDSFGEEMKFGRL